VPCKPTPRGKRTRTPPSRSGLVSSLTEKPAITRLLCCSVEDSGGNTYHMRFISVYIPKIKSVYIVSKLVCILLAKWCVGIGDPQGLVFKVCCRKQSRMEESNRMVSCK
jgi:hypothetical protein